MLTAPYDPWKKLSDGSKSTWLKRIDSQNDLFFQYIGKPLPFNSNYFVNALLGRKKLKCLWSKKQGVKENVELVASDLIQIDIVDRWDTMFTKFLSAVKYINGVIDYDYLIKINTTTWVNVDQLRWYLEVRQPHCAGVIDKNKTFPAGWASIFSHKLLDDILLSLTEAPLDVSGYDDELIGKVLARLGVRTEGIKFIDYPSNVYEELVQAPFIRIKSERERIINDIRKFHEINTKLQNNQ